MRAQCLALELLLMFSSLVAADCVQTQESEAVSRAHALVLEDRLDAAEQVLNSVLARAPREASALNLLGTIRGRQQRFEDAEKLFRKALNSRPGMLSASQNLALLYSTQGRSAEAIQELERAAGLNRESKACKVERKDLSLQLASLYEQTGQLAEAEAQYLSTLQVYPNSVETLRRLARLKSNDGEHVKAAEYLYRALEIAPNSEQLLYEYGLATLKAGSPMETVRALAAATRLNPNASQYQYGLGLAYLEVGDPISATDPLAKTAKLEPGKFLNHLALGTAYSARKQYENAKEVLQRCLTLDPGQPEALYLMAEIADAENELPRAEELARRGLVREPNHPGANLVLGSVLLKRGDLKGAQRALELAEKIDSSSPKIHYQLSHLYARLNDHARSELELQAYQSALKQSSEHLESVRRLLQFNLPESQPIAK